MLPKLFRILPTIFACLLSLPAFANNGLEAVQLTDKAWAIVGDLGSRSPENLGNNATFGFVITDEGIVLIDSGANTQAAKAIHEVVKSVSDQPIKTVINTGGQDHRWLGNGYFANLGAEIISTEAAKEDQAERFNDQWARLEVQVGEKGLVGTEDRYADVTFESDYFLSPGGTMIELHHAGQAHTPGDLFVWLPEEKVMYTGDIVYTQRLLGIMDHSNSKSWLSVFDAMAGYHATYLVPGHGQPTTLQRAKKETRDYLSSLRQKVAQFLEAGGDITDISQIEQDAFSQLENFDLLAGRNAQQVYTEMEFE